MDRRSLLPGLVVIGLLVLWTVVVGDEAFHVSGKVATFHSNAGHPGVAQAYTTVGGIGIVSALVYGDTGLKITFTGSTAALNDAGDDVGKMIDSIRYDARAAR